MPSGDVRIGRLGGPALCRGGAAVLLALLAGGAASAHAQGAPAATRSVVRVQVQRSGETSVGTGFAWDSPTTIVTALHVVAAAPPGAITVFSQRPRPDGTGVVNSTSTVRSVRALPGADLALLTLERDLGLVPLRHAAADLEQEHDIWGFPRGIPEMKSDRVRFSRGVAPRSTFASLFPDSLAFAVQVGDAGYPHFSTRILTISDIIQPGHSGAPILNRNGEVVGIGDGGLNEGIRRLNWAIPADYLPTLKASQARPPDRRPRAAAQFSALVESSDRDIVLAPPRGPSAADAGEEVLSWARTVPLREALATASEEDRRNVEALRLMILEATGFDVTDGVLEVYENYGTGATLAIPGGAEAEYDQASGLLVAASPSGRVSMMLQMASVESMESAAERAAAFLASVALLSSDQAWQEDPGTPDEMKEDGDSWRWEVSRIALDAAGEQAAQMLVRASIEGGEFLGAAVLMRDLEGMDMDDLRMFLLMAASAEMAGFAGR